MDVLDACNDLLVNSDGRFLMESLVLDYIIKQLAIGTVLHDEVQLGLSFDDLHSAACLPRKAK